MASILRSLAVALVRKLLPETVQKDPGTALARRSDDQLAPIADCRSKNFFAMARSSQNLYAPTPHPAPPRRRRIVIVVEETTEKS